MLFGLTCVSLRVSWFLFLGLDCRPCRGGGVYLDGGWSGPGPVLSSGSSMDNGKPTK